MIIQHDNIRYFIKDFECKKCNEIISAQDWCEKEYDEHIKNLYWMKEAISGSGNYLLKCPVCNKRGHYSARDFAK
ncbi:MAG: hypothetical protein ACOC56_04305, partial [Atribacterota bacterium]